MQNGHFTGNSILARLYFMQMSSTAGWQHATVILHTLILANCT